MLPVLSVVSLVVAILDAAAVVAACMLSSRITRSEEASGRLSRRTEQMENAAYVRHASRLSRPGRLTWHSNDEQAEIVA